MGIGLTGGYFFGKADGYAINTELDMSLAGVVLGKSPLRLMPSNSALAPAHSAYKGSLWATSEGKLYINVDGLTTWQLVGAQT
jgi:hypothetical protein